MPDPVEPVEVAPIVAAPVVEAVVAAPVEVAAVAEAPIVEAPAPIEAPVVVEAPVVAEPAAPATLTDLLKTASADGEPVEVVAPVDKPVEVVEAVKIEEPAVVAEPVVAEPVVAARLEPLAEYKYDIPEDLKLTDDQRTTFHTAVEDARNGNLQGLMDMHHQAIRAHTDWAAQNQRDVWGQQLQQWQDRVESDPDIGGAKFAGVSMRVAQLRDNFVSTHEKGTDGWKADMNEFNQMLDSTGVGNHPAMWKWANNMGKALAEAAHPTIVDPKPAPQGKRGSEVMYDNPRSPRPNGPN